MPRLLGPGTCTRRVRELFTRHRHWDGGTASSNRRPRSRVNSYDPFEPVPWPEDLPPRCEGCGHEFKLPTNLEVGPGRCGRCCRWLAWYGMLPWIPAAFVLLGSGLAGGFGFGSGGGMALVGFFVLPIQVFGTAAIFMPNSRRVRCFHCGYDRDFRAIPRKSHGSESAKP
jgi:hypothetical protein